MPIKCYKREIIHGTPGVRNDPNRWDMPGGGVEFGQYLADACIREITEEHGIVIPPDALTPLWVIEDLQNGPSGRLAQHWVSHTYLATAFSGTPRIMEPTKCTAMEWVTLREIVRRPITNTTLMNLSQARVLRPDLF